jgi:hypothetical protein
MVALRNAAGGPIAARIRPGAAVSDAAASRRGPSSLG